MDKQGLWGWWHYNQRWRENLHRRASHKALDIPEDDGMINSPRTTNVGMGWKELAVIGVIMAAGGWALLQMAKPDNTAPPPAVQQPDEPRDSEYEVRFFDAEGNPIAVPHITQKQAK